MKLTLNLIMFIQRYLQQRWCNCTSHQTKLKKCVLFLSLQENVDPTTIGGTRKIFVGVHEGEKCISECQRSKYLPKIADFGNFFLLTGQVGADPPTGGKMPPPPPPLVPPLPTTNSAVETLKLTFITFIPQSGINLFPCIELTHLAQLGLAWFSTKYYK